MNVHLIWFIFSHVCLFVACQHHTMSNISSLFLVLLLFPALRSGLLAKNILPVSPYSSPYGYVSSMIIWVSSSISSSPSALVNPISSFIPAMSHTLIVPSCDPVNSLASTTWKILIHYKLCHKKMKVHVTNLFARSNKPVNFLYEY